MMRKLLTIIAMTVAGAAATPTLSQSWDGPGAQPVQYITHQRGDGSNASGGTPPANAIAPADRPTLHSTTGFTYAANNTINRQSEELKFRIICGSAHTNKADFILKPGVPVWMHQHTYVGNLSTNENSTYASLRDYKFSTCPGGPLWNQAYWEPSLCKKVGGAQQCLRPDYNLFYYARGREVLGTLVSLPNFTRLILGMNPADMSNTSRLSEVPQGYLPPITGFIGWTCGATDDGGEQIGPVVKAEGNLDYYPALVTPTGGDPWAGQCKAGYRLVAHLIAPQCWDGKNLSAPNGRDHFRYKLEVAGSGGLSYCPDNWYDVPDLSVRVAFSIKKDAEYHVDQWYLSSDRMSADPAMWLRRGSSMHADWALTVDPDIWKRVMSTCLGIPLSGYTAIGGDCGTNGVDETTSLNANTPPAGSGYPTPIVSVNPKRLYSAKDRWYPLDAGGKGPFRVHAH